MNQSRPPLHTTAGGGTTPSPADNTRQPTSPHHNDPVAATAVAALSHSPSSEVPATNGRKRRASGVPGSRGVANLTPEQLAKKRANDREAQRAIRERTKNTIEGLEQRIRELESQQPFQDLQRAIAERDKALAECDVLRKRLSLVAGIVGAGTPPALHELAALTAQQSPLPSLQQHLQQQTPVENHRPSLTDESSLYSNLRSPRESNHRASPSHPAASVPVYYAGDTNMQRWPSNPGPQSHVRMSPQNSHPHSSQGPPQSQRYSGERLGLNFVLDSNQRPKPPSPKTGHLAFTSPSAVEQPLYSRLPRTSAPSCPLDSLLDNFVSTRHAQLQAGVSVSEVIGPAYPSFGALIHKGPSPAPGGHPISAMLVDILSKFPDIYALPEQVAVLYIMFLVMRWTIHPSRETYEDLPEWVRPTSDDLEKPHPIWIGHLPWPNMRRALINGGLVPFEEFFVPFTTTLSINWPYSAEEVLVKTQQASHDSTAVRINPTFEAHLRDLRNWSLGPKFQQTFPRIVDESVRIQEPIRK